MKEKTEIIIINIIFTYGTVQLRELNYLNYNNFCPKSPNCASLLFSLFQFLSRKNTEFPSNVISWSAICA